MKVKIGPYIEWWGPYQLADLLQRFGVSEDKCHDIGTWIADNTPMSKICQWIYDKRKRRVEVHIDDFDVWNMDSTLAHIILPMLKILKEKKHGSPMVDDEDVPEHLKCPNYTRNESLQLDMFGCEETDKLIWESFHKKWEYILDEIIWAFEQKNTDWEEQYWKAKPEIDWEATKANGDEEKGYVTIWKQEGSLDIEGYTRHQERMNKGFALFGKYYCGLWD